MEKQQASAAPVMIDIQGVRKVYPSQAGQVVALDGIDLTIRKGDIYGIIGMSGAGKSTLIRCINRLDTPTDGRIFIDGENILTMGEPNLRRMRRSVAMIFQQFNLLMQRTVLKNVCFCLEIAGVPRKKAEARAMELLEIVGLSEKAGAYPSQLSGGQRQRVAIARALATDPKAVSYTHLDVYKRQRYSGSSCACSRIRARHACVSAATSGSESRMDSSSYLGLIQSSFSRICLFTPFPFEHIRRGRYRSNPFASRFL